MDGFYIFNLVINIANIAVIVAGAKLIQRITKWMTEKDDKVNRHEKELYGNGQPGLVRNFVICQATLDAHLNSGGK